MTDRGPHGGRLIEVDDAYMIEMLRQHWLPAAEKAAKAVIDVCYPQELVDGIIATMGLKGVLAATEAERQVGDAIAEQYAAAFLHGARVGIAEIVARLNEEGENVTLTWDAPPESHVP